MLDVRLRILGDEQYARRFDVLARDAGDLKDPLQRVRDLLVRTTGENFQTEGTRGTGGWQPLSPAYAAWKESAFPGRPMLVRTGDMRSAFLTQGTRELTSERLLWGVDTQTGRDGHPIAERAAAHQTGSGVPERKIVALTRQDRREVDRIFVEWFADVRRRVGLER